ncbi:MAG TPA: aminoacyl-tRNA hydrolase [Bryobacteraceae bacterium]|nr:aminoacyl-tRNA hydrolase [Bryobacteraceae bacterium]
MPWLIAGLGNPGPEYELTPHNLGFLAIDRLAARHSIRVSRQDSKALIGVGSISSQPVILAKPQTFMNLSGTSIKPLLEKHGVESSQLVVVHDELDLPWTGLRIRPKGSAAGNHGIESVIKSLGTQEFPRVRLGINPGHPVRNGAQFVLAPMKRAQLDEMDELLDHAAGAVESIIAEGVEKSMTKFNRRARGLQKEEE